MKPVWVGEPGELKFAGPAVTVRTYDGDWSAPVQAIDHAKPGDVIVIDACQGETAVWGELAIYSCISKEVVGVVIDGAVRDQPSVGGPARPSRPGPPKDTPLV